MKRDFIIENLIKIGLTKSQAVIYINLLKKQSFTASEVSKISEISRAKTYEILNQLVKKGLCVEILGSVKKYSPANPDNAFNGMIQRYEQDCKQELEYKKILKSNISESLLPLFFSEKKHTDPLDYIQIIREKSAITAKFESLHKEAKEQILCFAKSPYIIATGKNIPGFNTLKRGVILKTIYEFRDTKKEDIKREIQSFIKGGEQVKIFQDLPVKMEVYDKKIVLLALVDNMPSKQSFTTLIIQHPEIAKTFIKLFDNLWDEAMTLEEFTKRKEKKNI